MTNAQNRFFLARMVLSDNSSCEISETQYENIAKARKTLSEIELMQERFNIVCENFKEIEMHHLNTILDYMIFMPNQLSDFAFRRSEFGRIILSFLASSRLYLDTIFSSVYAISKSKSLFNQLKSHVSHEYDTNFSYRCLDAIRNYSQHRAFPVHGISYTSEWNDDRTKSEYELDWYFDIHKIGCDGKFKKTIQSELMDLDSHFSLKTGVRLYFASLCKVHMFLNEKMKIYDIKSINIMKESRNIWKTNFDDEYLNVEACCLKDGLIVDKFEKFSICIEIDEYRERLASRLRGLINMDKRRILY